MSLVRRENGLEGGWGIKNLYSVCYVPGDEYFIYLTSLHDSTWLHPCLPIMQTGGLRAHPRELS